ncbi:MAG: hypothetical protein IT285_08875 [Bdellovibrionales bacterium]|nr:hypothetical protein [Bdellovibrionales bacterium]
MTSPETSDPKSPEEGCPRCGGPLALRPVRAQPVLLQAIFGGSFLAFLGFSSWGSLPREAAWIWTAAQVALGVALARARMIAKRRVSRCLRCDTALR